MRGQGVLAFAIGAAFVALILSQKAQAMTDAINAGFISNPDDDPSNPLQPIIEANTMQPIDPSANAAPSALSDAGIVILKTLESFSATPYWDHQGQSIGYGHLILPGEAFTVISEPAAADLLAHDVSWAQDCVAGAVTVLLNQNEFDALTIFTFNVGKGGFLGSTLLKKVNALDATAVDEFGKWIYARDANGNKVIDAGLQKRRAIEAALFAG